MNIINKNTKIENEIYIVGALIFTTFNFLLEK